jgi:aminopeptidase N
VVLDGASQAYGLAHLDKFDDALLRQLLWQTFYNMTRDAAMSAHAYLRLVKEKVEAESDLRLVGTILDRAGATLRSFVPEEQADAAADTLFELAWRHLQTERDAEARIVWLRALIGFGSTLETVTRLVALLSSAPEGLAPDQSMRWSIVTSAVAYGVPNARELLAAEEQRDASDRGKREAAAARASEPSAAAKAAAWEQFRHNRDNLSLHMIQSGMHGFQWRVQRALLAPYADRFFDEVRAVFAEKEREYAKGFCDLLYPRNPEDDHVLARTQQLIAQCSAADQILKRSLEEALDDAQRARKCRAFSRGRV